VSAVGAWSFDHRSTVNAILLIHYTRIMQDRLCRYRAGVCRDTLRLASNCW